MRQTSFFHIPTPVFLLGLLMGLVIFGASSLSGCGTAKAGNSGPRKIDVPAKIDGAPAELQQLLAAMPELDKVLAEVQGYNEKAQKGEVEKAVIDSFGPTERVTIEAYKARLNEKAQPMQNKAQAVVGHLNSLRDKLRVYGAAQGWFSAQDAGRFEVVRDSESEKWQMIETPK